VGCSSICEQLLIHDEKCPQTIEVIHVPVPGEVVAEIADMRVLIVCQA
jgi:hypothetical protein